MPETTAEFFEELGRRGHDPLVAKATGTIRCDLVDDKRTERWLVSVRNGHITVSRKAAQADCRLRVQKALFDRLVRGEANAMTALLRGEMSVDGDVRLLVLLQRLFPGPPSSRDRLRAAGNAKTQP